MYSERLKEKYDMRVLNERNYPETLIMACILNNLSLLEDYNLKDTDILNTEYAILLRVAKRLKAENYDKVTLLEIKGRLTELERECFSDNDIWKILTDYNKLADFDNFDDYVDQLYKNNIYLKLIDIGVDIFKPMKINGRDIVPFEDFRDWNSTEVKSFYEDYVNDFSTVDVDKGIDEEILDFDDDYMEATLNGQLVGTLFDIAGYDYNDDEIVAFPTISTESNGFIDGSLSMLSGYSSVGKSTFLISLTMALVYNGEKVVICSNEQKSTIFKDNFLMWILVNKLGYEGISKKKLKKGRECLNEMDLQMLEKAREIWRNEYKGSIAFISLPFARMEVVEKKFKEYHLKHDFTFFIYDTFKFDFDGNLDNVWLSLIKDSRTLQEFANRYGVKTFATMQNAINTQGQLWLDANVLSQSKQVKEVLQNLYLIRNMYKEERDNEDDLYCNPYTISTDETYMGMEVAREVPYKLDKTKDYKVIFLDKLREGKTSEQGNYAVVVEYDYKHGLMKEVCLCRPKRGFINGSQRNTAKRK